MATEINLNDYQLFDGGFKVFTLPDSPRVLVQTPDNLWFKAQKRSGTQFSTVPRSGCVTVFGSLYYIQDLCVRYTTHDAALGARPWEC